VQRDLAGVHAFRMPGTDTDDTGTSRITADIDAARGARMTIRDHDGTVTVLLVKSGSFIRASAAYWRGQGLEASVARRFGGRWVKSPTGALDRDLAQLQPKALARCVSRDHGTLGNAGVRSIGGAQAVIITDKGDKPATSPGELWVSVRGRALPLRERQTGKRRAGKVDTSCGEEQDDTTRAEDVRFSRYDKPTGIRAPSRYLVLADDGQGGGGTAPS